jgi:hypothetical protein
MSFSTSEAAAAGTAESALVSATDVTRVYGEG